MHLPISVAVHSLLWKKVLSFHLVLHFTFINIGLVVWNEKNSNRIKPLICVGVRFVKKYGRAFSSPVHVHCGGPNELQKNRVCGKIYPPIYANIFLFFFEFFVHFIICIYWRINFATNSFFPQLVGPAKRTWTGDNNARPYFLTKRTPTQINGFIKFEFFSFHTTNPIFMKVKWRTRWKDSTPNIGLSQLQNVVVGFVTTFLKVSTKTKTGMITNNATVVCRKDKYCHSWF